MTDMPDTTTTAPTLDRARRVSDDAAGYYTPGEPIRDTKAPGGPIEERWNTRSSRPASSTPPTAAGCR